MGLTYVNSQDYGTIFPDNPVLQDIDIGTRTNGLLVVQVIMFETHPTPNFSATYGGEAMTKDIEFEFTTTPWWIVYFSLIDPPDGNNEFSMSWTETGGTEYWQCATWYDGAKQTDVFDTWVNDEDTTGTTISVDITPNFDDCLILGMYFSQKNSLLTVGSGETETQTHGWGPRVCGGSYVIQTTASQQTVDWTGNADEDWFIAAASYQALAVADEKVPGLLIPSGRQVLAPRSRL